MRFKNTVIITNLHVEPVLHPCLFKEDVSKNRKIVFNSVLLFIEVGVRRFLGKLILVEHKWLCYKNLLKNKRKKKILSGLVYLPSFYSLVSWIF